MSTASIVTDRAEWLAERQRGVGASEAAAAMGVSPFESPRSLYLRKLGLIGPPEENEAMRQGSFMEPYILQLYEEKAHTKVVDRQLFFRSHITPLMATLDGMTAHGYPVECKYLTGFNRELGEEDTDDIPGHWLIQAHQQMLLSATYRVDFAVLPAGRPLRIYTVHRDEDLVELVIQKVREFWGYVERREAPPLDPRRDLPHMLQVYPGCEGEAEFSSEEANLVDAWEQYGRDEKASKLRKDTARAMLLEKLGERASARLPDGRVLKRRIITIAEKTVHCNAQCYPRLFLTRGDS